MNKNYSLLLLALGYCFCSTAQQIKESKLKEERERIIEEWKSQVNVDCINDYQNKTIHLNNVTMPFHSTTIGKEMRGKRSLWILLNSGEGLTETELQKTISSSSSEGIYIKPIIQNKEMWNQPISDTLIENLIEMMIVKEGVNPNKVYIENRSDTHIAERLSDHWATTIPNIANIADCTKTSREPYPKHIVWKQGELARSTFYWVSLPKAISPKQGDTFEAKIEGNNIEIIQMDYDEVTIWINEKMVDLKKPVTIKYNDKVIYNDIVKLNTSNLILSLENRKDPTFCFPANVTIRKK